ncbi:MAG: ATP cone domain-containing protein, partial [Terriglobia bacterium]
SKLLNGLVRATVKREITLAELENLVTEVEADLRNEFKYEVLASEIGELVLDKLRRLDGVAYVRFASVYRQFQDLDEFTRELKKLQAKGHLKNTDKG